MRLIHSLHFVTLVLAASCVIFTQSSHAAPENSVTPTPINTKPVNPSTTFEQNPNLESMQISQPPERQYHYRTKPFESWYADRTWNFSLGYAQGVFDVDEKYERTWTAGVHRTNYNNDDTAQEFGIEFNSLNLIGVHAGYKWFCCFSSSYEPYYKAAIAAYYDPKDALANFINFERYLVRGSIGFENLFRTRRKLRLETSAGLGPQGVTLSTQFIYAIPD